MGSHALQVCIFVAYVPCSIDGHPRRLASIVPSKAGCQAPQFQPTESAFSNVDTFVEIYSPALVWISTEFHGAW
jgi:hypothetical protein